MICRIDEEHEKFSNTAIPFYPSDTSCMHAEQALRRYATPWDPIPADPARENKIKYFSAVTSVLK